MIAKYLSLLGFIALLTLAGCANAPAAGSGGVKTTAGKSLPPFVLDADRADPNRPTSHMHWDALYSRRDDLSSASVMSTSQDNLIQIVCYKNDLFLQVIPKAQLSSALSSRRLSLGFDDGPLAEQPWKAVQVTKQDWTFDAGYGQAGFHEAIAGFKQHHGFTTAISESGKEAMRQSYTLDGAAPAIDFVLAACGKKDLL
jgi:hypothetical protein